MTEEEIREAVAIRYPEFMDYMKRVQGYHTVSEMSQLIEWEIWKEKKRVNQIQQDVHEDIEGMPDD
jgi:hypothetical protein